VSPQSSGSSQRILGRLCSFDGCFVVASLGRCFAADVTPLSQMLYREVSGGCFAAELLVVRVDTLLP
jgi:hypothetical protein